MSNNISLTLFSAAILAATVLLGRLPHRALGK